MKALRLHKRSSWHRDVDRLLRALGYEPVRIDSSSHFVYRHPEGHIWRVPSSPSDFRTDRIMRQQLRRRHPDHPALKTSRKTHAGHKPKRQATRIAKVIPIHQGRRRAKLSMPERTACVECGRLWISDLDPSFRACPRCGGDVVVGRDRLGMDWRAAA